MTRFLLFSPALFLAACASGMPGEAAAAFGGNSVHARPTGTGWTEVTLNRSTRILLETQDQISLQGTGDRVHIRVATLTLQIEGLGSEMQATFAGNRHHLEPGKTYRARRDGTFAAEP